MIDKYHVLHLLHKVYECLHTHTAHGHFIVGTYSTAQQCSRCAGIDILHINPLTSDNTDCTNQAEILNDTTMHIAEQFPMFHRRQCFDTDTFFLTGIHLHDTVSLGF